MWNEYYNEKLEEMDDLYCALDRRVGKDMCNCGCDAYNALAMICDDVFGDKDVFNVYVGEESPSIEFI